jgi:hypothetical protein
MVHESKNRRIAPAARRRINLVADAHAAIDAQPLPRDGSIFNEQAETVFSMVARVSDSATRGTIDAAVVPLERQYFGGEADAVARNDPFPPAVIAAEARAVSASDLIAELREIGGQVSRMMEQVERAIDRFAIHAG